MDELKLKPAAGYLRVSTDRQREEKTAEAQRMEILDWSKEHGYEIVIWYVDEGWSGDMLARPDLDRLRDDADKNLWKTVIACDPDRIARRYAYQELVKDELIEKRIEVICIHQAQALTPEDRILQGFQGLFAEYERVKIAERMRRGKIRKARDKKLVGHHAPYGYRYILKTQERDGYFEVYEPEAEIVRTVFHLVADEGYSIYRVAQELYKRGIAPPKRKKEYWPKSSIARMLNRKDYIGISYYNRNEAVIPKNPIKIEKYKRIKKSSRRVRPKEDWFEIPVPRIIDDELFYRAKQRMKENFLYGKRNKHYEYLLSGKVFCGCGHRRVGDGVNGHHYYRSAERIYAFPNPVSGKCKCQGVNAEILDAMVFNKLLELLSNPLQIKAQAERWNEKQSKMVNTTSEEIKRLKTTLETLTDEEKRYTRAYATKLLDFEQYKMEMKEIKGKRENLESKIKEYDQKAPDDAVNLDSFESVCDTIYYSLKHSVASEKQEYLRNLIVSIYVGERSKALVNGRIPLLSQAQNIHYESISRDSWFAECGKVHAV